MVLEWIRRKDPAISKQLKEYLFSEKPIAHKVYGILWISIELNPASGGIHAYGCREMT